MLNKNILNCRFYEICLLKGYNSLLILHSAKEPTHSVLLIELQSGDTAGIN